LNGDLAAVIEAHHAWHAENHPNNPDWFPHRDSKTRPAETSAMTQQLRRAAKALGTPARTSHGLRAYYVTVRRSQGIPDGQIAAEIGDRTGASIIASTYGEIPPSWQGGAGMSWTVPGNPVPWVAR
jgi:integrase